MKEKLKEQILKLKGSEFKEWYDSLGDVGRAIYKKIREEMEEEFERKRNLNR